jgi:hypothetical protein
MLKECNNDNIIKKNYNIFDFINMSQNDKFDLILMKEIIHHLEMTDYELIFSKLTKMLKPNGKIIIITRPQKINYPFFEKAHIIWKENQPEINDIASKIRNDNLNVQIIDEYFKVKINKFIWINMIKNRFWSIFSKLTDDEIEDAIKIYEDQPNNLIFDDALLFLTVSLSKSNKYILIVFLSFLVLFFSKPITLISLVIFIFFYLLYALCNVTA